jgi:hypothetical protein
LKSFQALKHFKLLKWTEHSEEQELLKICSQEKVSVAPC